MSDKQIIDFLQDRNLHVLYNYCIWNITAIELFLIYKVQTKMHLTL